MAIWRFTHLHTDNKSQIHLQASPTLEHFDSRVEHLVDVSTGSASKSRDKDLKSFKNQWLESILKESRGKHRCFHGFRKNV